MRTSVQEDDTVVWSVGDALFHASEIETFCLLGEVWVCSYWETDIGEDLVVVGPGGVAEVDCGVAWVEAFEEQSSEMDCSCSGDGLDGACSLFGECWRGWAQNELCGGGGEGCKTGDGKIFVVQRGVIS